MFRNSDGPIEDKYTIMRTNKIAIPTTPDLRLPPRWRTAGSFPTTGGLKVLWSVIDPYIQTGPIFEYKCARECCTYCFITDYIIIPNLPKPLCYEKAAACAWYDRGYDTYSGGIISPQFKGFVEKCPYYTMIHW